MPLSPFLSSRLGELVASDRPGRAASRLLRRESWEAALGVLDRPSIWVVTGFFIPEAQAPETDGPSGACVLARALLRRGVEVRLLTDLPCLPALRAAGEVLGLGPDRFAGFPFDVSEERLREELLRDAPAGLVYLERLGRTEEGTYRNMRGRDISPWVAPLDLWALEAPSRGIPVLGVGDGGNEAGMGNLRGELAPLVGAFAASLSCVGADVTLPVDVSNWGGYALAAALGLRAGEDLLHTPEEERGLLRALRDAGAVDGTTRKPGLSVDGFGEDVQVEILEGLRALAVKTGL